MARTFLTAAEAGAAGAAGTRRRRLYLAAGAAALWALAMILLLGQKPAQVLGFLAYQALCVAAPGLALLRVSGLRLRRTECAAVAGGLGFGANIALYCLLDLCGLLGYARAGAGVLAALSLLALFLLRRRPSPVAADGPESAAAFAFALFALFATTLLLSAAMLTPDLAGTRSFFHDAVYSAGNIVSASRGDVSATLFAAGGRYSYYAFYYFYGALLRLTLGLSAFDVLTKYALVTFAPLAVTALTALFFRITRSAKGTALLTALFCLVPSFYGVHYLYEECLGYTPGLALLLTAALLFLSGYAEDSRWCNRSIVFAALFLVLATGVKASMIASVVFGLCFLLLVRFLRKPRPGPVVQGLVFAAPAIAVFFLTFGSGLGGSLIVLPLYSATYSDFALAAAQVLPRFLWYPVCLLEYLFALDGIFYLLLIAIAAAAAKKLCAGDPLAVFCLAAGVFGTVVINIFKQEGNSEWYFITSLLPFVYAEGAVCLVRLRRAARARTRRPVFAAVLAALCVPFLVYNAAVSLTYWRGDASPAYLSGTAAALRYSRFGNAFAGLPADSYVNAEPNDATRLTAAQYEAYVWLRDNTPADSVIASGAVFVQPRNCYGSTFSERTFYLDGYKMLTIGDKLSLHQLISQHDTYLRFLYLDEDETALPLLAKEGVGYVLIDRNFNPGFAPGEDYAHIVFRNSEVTVYQLPVYDAG